MDARTAVHDYLADFAKSLANQDVAACAGAYSDDALLLPPDAPALAGTAEIETMFKSMFEGGVRSTELTTVDVFEEGSMIVETGEFVFTIEPAGRMEGKYLAVYRRQADGTLKCIREAFNSNAPAA
jgi:uncharacterized protein (TIGR02246 family)